MPAATSGRAGVSELCAGSCKLALLFVLGGCLQYLGSQRLALEWNALTDSLAYLKLYVDTLKALLATQGARLARIRPDLSIESYIAPACGLIS